MGGCSGEEEVFYSETFVCYRGHVHVKYLSSVRLYVELKKLFGLKDGASLCAIRHLWTGQKSILWDHRGSSSYLAREAPLLRCYVTQ